MKYCVTGTLGFVGTQVVRSLQRKGHSVRILIRREDDPRFSRFERPGEIERIAIPGFSESSLTEFQHGLRGSEILIHCAWHVEPGNYLENPKNIDCLAATLRLGQAFSKVGGRKFVGIGTCFEYNVSNHRLAVDSELDPKSLYAKSKVAASKLLEHSFRSGGIEFLWARIFLFVWGKRGSSKFISIC